MNFYKRHIGDYLRDTAHLTLLEHGIYARLMDVYYATESGIPDDQCERLIGARTKKEKQATRFVLQNFFKKFENEWKNKRCEFEIEKASARATANTQNGRLGGRPKKTANPEPERVTEIIDSGFEKPTGFLVDSGFEKPTGFFLGSILETQKNLSQTPDTRHQTPDTRKSNSNSSRHNHLRQKKHSQVSLESVVGKTEKTEKTAILQNEDGNLKRNSHRTHQIAPYGTIAPTDEPICQKEEKQLKTRLNASAERLPKNWVLPRIWGEWALQERTDWTPDTVRQVSERFRDHWLAKAGADARKVDWAATWRNWVRREPISATGQSRAFGIGGVGINKQEALEARNREVGRRWLEEEAAKEREAREMQMRQGGEK